MTKDELIAALTLESQICKHLFEKLPREGWEKTLAYKPSPEQRDTLHLLRYLASCGIGGAQYAVEGVWDGWKRVSDRVDQMPAEEFPAMVDVQLAEIVALLQPLSDDELASRVVKNPFGQELSLRQAIYDMPLRWLIGYRMQLFLYARALGAAIGTSDCWYGFTTPPKAR